MKIGKVVSFKALSTAVIACAAVLYSCKKDAESPLNSTDSQNVNSESVSASTSNEAADLGNAVISNVTNVQLSTGRVSGNIDGLGLKDRRLTGATITITPDPGTSKTNPSGTITIDYKTGVTTDGVTRKGKIIIVFHGKRLKPQSTRAITFDGFSRNAIKVDGTYNVTVLDSAATSTDVTVTFTHTTAVVLTFPNSTTITRNATFTVVWDYVINTPAQSTITHKSGSTAEGTDRKLNAYTMAITKDVVYRADCFASGYVLPISGTKTFAVTSANSTNAAPTVYTVDYGTATCDNTITVTLNGKTVTITVSADGN